MSHSRAEQLTAHFYDWEKLGRGWYVFTEPVDLEPEFVPFFPYATTKPTTDESLRPPLLNRVASFIERTLTPGQQEQVEESSPKIAVSAYPFQSEEVVKGFSVSFTREDRLSKAQEIAKFLTMLSFTNHAVCFEIMAWSDLIRIQFICRESDVLHVESQVRAYFPSCIIRPLTEAGLGMIIDSKKYFAIVDFGLSEEFVRPLAMSDKYTTDPLTGLYGVLEHLQNDEQVVLQFLFKGVANPWAESMYRSVIDAKGESFFMDAPDMPKLTQEKISAPLFATCIRVLGQDTTTAGALRVVEKVGTVLMQGSKSASNSLIALTNTGRDAEEMAVDIWKRQTRRVGMILNAHELATFVHYPQSVHSAKLEHPVGKTKRAPDIAWGADFCLGRNTHHDFEGIVTLTPQQRLKHMHVIGATGTGKSTLLQSCIVQDIHLGNGITVLDPHGDLIESILPYIPENRYNDVVIIDPADGEFPVGFNILNAHSDIEKEILASDLVAVFRRLSTSFGDQMHSVLANAILAFLESTEGGTLMDLRRFLIEKDYRSRFLKTVSDSSVVYYWQKEYPLLKSNSIGPILTRLDSFLRPKLIRNMVAQKKSLDFESLMDTRKIVLIKLSQGLIGTENSYLLGTFFVSKIYQTAMARQAKSKDSRANFYMYIDEFQNFVTPSMSSILSGTRKYGLGCILAHQDMSQLQKYDTELANAVVSNAGTRVCFKIGDIDAKRFAEGFHSFEAQDIQNLGVGHAICRIERPEYDFTISTLMLNEIEPEKAEETKQVVISRSREVYGTPKAEVEVSLAYLSETTRPEAEPEPQREIVATPPPKTKPIEEVTIATEERILPVEITDGKTKAQLVRQKELSEHRYLQMYIKKMAEARGFNAKIEEPTLDGGRVDVLLERNGRKIACEIGMTTSVDWEIHNIQKCLDSGYDFIVAVVKNREALIIMQEAVSQKIEAFSHFKVSVMEVETFIKYLDAEIGAEVPEVRMKGYRVKVKYDDVSAEVVNQKREAIAKAVYDSLKSKQ